MEATHVATGSPRPSEGAVRGPRATLLRRASLVLATAAVALIAPTDALAAAPFQGSVSPGSVIAGSSGNSLRFKFTANEAVTSTVAIRVPAVQSGSPWTRPQSENPQQAGFVRVSKGRCESASISDIKGDSDAPWMILVNARCDKDKGFAVIYGGTDSASVTSPTVAGDQTFRTTFPPTGADAIKPVVTVLPGPASQLAVSGLSDGTAGDTQFFTVTLRDVFGNVARGYRGTVRFDGNGKPGWELPGDYAFTAVDSGVHSFAATPKTAGPKQALTATDTGNS